jgi:hypothetical protein
MTLHEHYNDIATTWRWAALEFLKRATTVETFLADKIPLWEGAAATASRRAARYARLAEACRLLERGPAE